MDKLIAFLRLIRPANIVTSFADIFAGFGVVAIPLLLANPNLTYSLTISLILLLISTAGLYGGGIVFNDIWDFELDRLERPERPLPSGIITKNQGIIIGSSLLLMGVLAALLVSPISALLALLIAFLALVYDGYTKPRMLLGPLNMGLCRALNLLLGMSLVLGGLITYWILIFIPLAFIAGVTLMSKGEVHGSNRFLIMVSLLLYCLAILGLLLLVFTPNFHFLPMLPFLLLFSYLILSSLFKVMKNPDPQVIRRAVKIGILSLIVMDAAIASGYAGFWYGVLMLLLLPISILFAKKFSIT